MGQDSNYSKDDDFRGDDVKDDFSSRRKVYLKRKVCRFCVDKNLKIDYKEIDTIRRFVTEGGKIIPRRISGNCSKHQRKLADQIKLARQIALLPYVKQ
ncbi:MAG TPA: 30S ribosomal protein S18 [Spirochaetota bacterium]|jgi:small subunit ribosomal protein S18|nr:MAG: 30S ribosomal protein S18 [Spirochaetes bacterium ADurb.Bin133]HNZ25896.1 30S ribosomal protein S18 [Spirochaetota bacterium]HOF00197.1 30S ribosomal protein S18 [Spirochaetota bacterium]HOS33579.1 30S ribosomal protein S18 [Spirochaetota bacterium]HOS54872.1 30S ribosomal protein S18 [Spirochaetota bacterium]